MKKSLLLALFLISSSSLFAQVELTPYGGWFWTGSVYIPSYSGYFNGQDAKVTDMGNYGVRLGVRLPSFMIAEFEWNHTNFDLTYRDLDGDKASIPVSSNYYWLGAVRELKEGPMIPFGIFNIGAVNFKNTEDDVNATYFAIGFGGGIKYFMSDKVGIRLQARLMAPMTFNGIYVGCGMYGCGSGASTYSSIIQGDFTGGIILKLGGE